MRVLFITLVIIIGFGFNDRGKSKPASFFKSNVNIESLISRMSLEQKIGQMSQVQGTEGNIATEYLNRIRRGTIGSILNENDPDAMNELQRVAVEESELGIPILLCERYYSWL
ncbi:MAG: glycoside hydrolase family 3 N-terminal domain-containing protein [Bacteroidota bacterium]|nr:glycoside hydrolase family 3 N-terminal domain-containing protein [Bacteroidota bacterium]